MAIRRYMLTVAYDGSEFHGWQEQKPPDAPPLRTVQGVLSDAIVRTVQQPVHVQGASRTDTGVHAVGQVAHFDAQTRIPVEKLHLAINSRLPHDVEVRGARIVRSDFDATRDAISKQYRYRLWMQRHRPLHLRHLMYHCHARLNVEAMRDAAHRLIGEHDFAAFAAADHQRASTVRTIHHCDVETYEGPPPIDGHQVHIVVSGSGFLYNMVRIIVGTLVEVGRGHWQPDYIDRLLAEPKRELAGPTMPPYGLCLEWIKYPDIVLIPDVEVEADAQSG